MTYEPYPIEEPYSREKLLSKVWIFKSRRYGQPVTVYRRTGDPLSLVEHFELAKLREEINARNGCSPLYK